MSDEPLLTLRQLALELNLPESTVRYYRNAFLDHIPSVGMGRRRRYPREAVQVLRSIADDYAAGRLRRDITSRVSGHAIEAPAIEAEHLPTATAMDDITNLDLLAAILDGEREQRDALWQMAKEIVRLTEVLDDQDKVLGAIADQAGVAVAALPPGRSNGELAALAAPAAVVPPPPPPPPEPPPPPAAVSVPQPFAAPPPAPRISQPSLRFSGGTDMDGLRAELEAERALVERLREAKLQLEHRAADAEAALEENKPPRRSSVIRRLLGPDK